MDVGTESKFDSWAIVDIFGHQKFAGRVTEQSIGGASFVRIDIPQVEDHPAYTKLFGAAAIYCITPTTEELARKAVDYCHSEPISIYIPPAPPQLTGKPLQPKRDDQERLDLEPF